MSQTKISVTKALNVLKTNGSKMLSATFVKKNGQPRTINGMIKDSSTALNPQGYVTIWDVQNKGYRKANLQTLTSFKCGGTSYTINRSKNYVGQNPTTSK